MNPFNQAEKTSQDSRFVHQIAHEFYDDGNPDHYVNDGEERETDAIEILRNPASEPNFQAKTSLASQHQAELSSHVSEYCQQQAGTKITPSRSVASHQFQSLDGSQHLDGNIISPPNPVLPQFTNQENPESQYNSPNGVNFSDDRSAMQSQREPLRLFNGFPTLQEALRSARERDNDNPDGEGEDRDNHKNPSEEFEVPRVDLDVVVKQVEKSDLNVRNLELSREHLEDHNGTAQDFDYEIPRLENMQYNIGHPEVALSAESPKGGTQKNELRISGDTYLGIEEVNTVHLANPVLSSMLENLEEGGEVGFRTYDAILSSCHMPTVEDTVMMLGYGPAAADTQEIFQKEAGPTTRRVFHNGECLASKNQKLTPKADEVDASERQYNQLLPARRFELATSDNMPPVGGYGMPAGDNFPQNYGAERGVYKGPHNGYSLGGEYRHAVNDGLPSRKGATSATNTNHCSETPGQRDISHQKYGVPITMGIYPVNFSRELNDIAYPSSFQNAQFGRPVVPRVQPQIQMPRSGHNPESDVILPSIEFDIVDGNNSAEHLNTTPENQANIRPLDITHPAKANPVHWDMSLNMEAPDSISRYAMWWENEAEADYKTALMNELTGRDPNPPIIFYDSNSVARCASQRAMESNYSLETEGKATIKGEVIDNASPKPHGRPFYYAKMRQRRPGRPDQHRRASLQPIRSPKEYSPPKETGPEIPNYDFSDGEVPILPPDFNTAQEIKRRVLAKNMISSKTFEKRCRQCGFMGHVCSWPGCPGQWCQLCHQEGHGKGFCPRADIGDRWRDRHGKIAIERLRLKRMEKMERKTKLGVKLGRGKARIDKEQLKAPVENMTTWPMVAFENAPRVALMNQAQRTEGEMGAPVAQMATWPMVYSSDGDHNISSAAKDHRTYATMNVPWADINTGKFSAPAAQIISTGPMIENHQNIALMTNDNWPCTEGQPCYDSYDRRMGTQRQEPVSCADTTRNQQGNIDDPVVEQYRPDGQGGSFLWEVEDARAASAECTESSEYMDDTETETESP